MRATLRPAELLVVRPPRTREAELQAGRVGTVVTDQIQAMRLASAQDRARLVEPPDRFGEALAGYAVPRGDPRPGWPRWMPSSPRPSPTAPWPAPPAGRGWPRCWPPDGANGRPHRPLDAPAPAR